MKNRHAFALSRQAEFASASSFCNNNKALKAFNQTPYYDPLTGRGQVVKDAVQGDGRKGFTLIELLVVVLIIGVLAAIAVPQYKKAVIKSQIVRAITVYRAYSQAIDRWMLENPLPNEATYFTGSGKNYKHASLDVEFAHGEGGDNGASYDILADKRLSVIAFINPTFNQAIIRVPGAMWYEHIYTEKYLNGCGFAFTKFMNKGEFDRWRFAGVSDTNNVPTENATPPEHCLEVVKMMCGYWKSIRGADFSGTAKAQCDYVGVPVERRPWPNEQ